MDTKKQNYTARIENVWRTEIRVKDGKINVYIMKTAKNETEAERIIQEVELAGGTLQKKIYTSPRLETVENKSEAECYHQHMTIENDETCVWMQLRCNL